MRLLGKILKGRIVKEANYETAMRRALSREPFLNTDGCYLSRGEAHERTRHGGNPIH